MKIKVKRVVSHSPLAYVERERHVERRRLTQYGNLTHAELNKRALIALEISENRRKQNANR